MPYSISAISYVSAVLVSLCETLLVFCQLVFKLKRENSEGYTKQMSVILVIPPVGTDIYPGIYNNKKHRGSWKNVMKFLFYRKRTC